MSTYYDLIVIGSGPGGYVAAVRATQLNMKVAVVEKAEVGGTCLNWGCIPTKALIKTAEEYSIIKNASRLGFTANDIGFDFNKVVNRSRTAANILSKGVNKLFENNKIDLYVGLGKVLSAGKVVVQHEDQSQELTGKNILIATGAKPRVIPGMEFDGTHIISSKEAMVLSKVPESMVIIGAGVIGIEFAFIYNTFGTKVTLIEMMPNILPTEDTEIANELAKSFARQKIKVITNTKVDKIIKSATGVTVFAGEKEITAEVALNAVGVQPDTAGLGLDNLGIETDRGWIKVNRTSYATNIPGIYAIGDIIGPPWLAHVASAEGIRCVERLVGLHTKPIDYNIIPGCVYCTPQVASVGLNEQQAISQGYSVKIGRFPFAALGKARAVNEVEGMVKLVFDSINYRLLGGSILGGQATDMVSALVLALEVKLTAQDIIHSIQAHPTFSEAIKEAAEQALGQGIHGKLNLAILGINQEC